MSLQQFKDYRCGCGKLLFKGILFLAAVEVKCRRCGAIQSEDYFDAAALVVIESDAAERVVEVSGDVRAAFGCERDYLVGKRISEVCPVVSDDSHERKPLATDRAYKIFKHMLILKDGGSVPFLGCLIPKHRAGALAGYHMLARRHLTGSA